MVEDVFLLSNGGNMGKEEIIKELGEELKLKFDKREVIKSFLEKHPIFYDKAKIWWMWSEKEFKWLLVDEVDIMNLVSSKTMFNTINSKERLELLEALKQEGRKLEPKPIKKTWVQFKNRIYDIEGGKWIFASPEYFVTNPIPWELGENPETPTIDKLFTEWVGEDYIKTLYQIMAYCLLPDYPMQRLFCFTGSGSNGKSCFMKIVSNFLGIENTTTTELDVLLESRFEITRLHKKLACMLGETNFGEMKKTSILKKLTGNDLIGFEYKNKNPFEDYNYAKILISTNSLPTTSDKSLGFYRRWLIIDFPNRFKEAKDVLRDIPKEEYNNLAKRLLVELNNLLIVKEFWNEGDIELRMKRFEDRADPLGKFLKEYTEEDWEGNIFKFEFIKRFNDFCKDNNHRIFSETYIGIKMKERGYESSRVTADWHSKEGEKPRYMAWGGIKWKN